MLDWCKKNVVIFYSLIMVRDNALNTKNTKEHFYYYLRVPNFESLISLNFVPLLKDAHSLTALVQTF